MDPNAYANMFNVPGGGGGYPPQQQGYGAYPPQGGYAATPAPAGGYPPQQGYGGYPPQQGYGAYPPQGAPAPGGYAAAPAAPQGAPAYPPQAGYAAAPGGYAAPAAPQGAPGYPPAAGAPPAQGYPPAAGAAPAPAAAAVPKAAQPIAEIRRAKWWQGADHGQMGQMVCTGEIEGYRIWLTDGNPIHSANMISAGYDGFELWNPGQAAGAYRKIENPDKKDFNYRHFDVYGDTLVGVGGYSNSRADLHVFSINTGQVVHKYSQPGGYYMLSCALLNSPTTPNQIWTTDYSFGASIYDYSKEFMVRKIPLKAYTWVSLKNPKDPNSIFVADSDNKVHIFDVRNSSNQPTLSFTPGDSFRSISKTASMPEFEVYIASSSIGIQSFDTRKALPVRKTSRRATMVTGYGDYVAYTDSGVKFLSNTQGWDGEPLHELNYTNQNCWSLAMNGEVLVTTNYNYLFAVTY